MDSLTSRQCTMCLEIKLFNEFPKHKGMANGINSRCKNCHTQVNRQYKEKNRDKVRESNRNYHIKNKELRNARRSARYWSNAEKIRQKNRLNYPLTAEQQKEASRQWRKNNPEKFRIQQRRRRARMKNVYSVPYSKNDVFALHGINCWICSAKIDFKATPIIGQSGWEFGLHLDHIIPISINGPDVVWNVRPAHAICNLRRPRDGKIIPG